MTRKRRSERSRWVQIFYLSEPQPENLNGYAQREFQKLRVIVDAFEKVGRVVRVESSGSTGVAFKARKG